MHLGSSGNSSISSGSNTFKRFSLVDLFDEQYGHLARNDILNEQRMDEKRQIGLPAQAQGNRNTTLHLFVVAD